MRFDEIKQDLIVYFKRRSLIPIVGAGISCGAPARNGCVPSGTEYQEYMLEELISNESFTDEDRKVLKSASFSTLCDYYEDDEHVAPDKRQLYLKHNFSNAAFEEDDIRRRFFEIDWPYIYSLNVDDVIENSSDYKTIILPKREYRDEIFAESKCLIKLHGDIKELVTYKDGCKIFSSKEYALSLEQNTPLLNKLRNDYANQNILFIGCSLSDEIDLKTLSGLPVDFSAKDGLRKTIIFVKGSPSKLQISTYKTYGVNEVVSFDDYDSMYMAIMEAWTESQRIGKDEIDQFGNMNMQYLRSNQREANHDYFFWGKSLSNTNIFEITYPYFFISRAVSVDIIKNLRENKIHIISGNRISGKTYLLAGLYREIRDRRVCFFDGKSRLSDAALQILLSYENSVILLDIGTLSREQFETILESARKIREKKCNFIICIKDNDSDANGLIKYKKEHGLLDETDIIRYRMDNRFKNSIAAPELEMINRLLPPVNLPPYSEKRTLLDQLVYAEKTLGARSRFDRCRIKIDHYKQLALLLIMAINEKMFSLEVIKFALDQEIAEALKKYDPFIERVETLNYEKDAVDISSLKYILNSKYWLRRELGEYAQKRNNYAIIADAYRYIIRKAIAAAGAKEHLRRKNCKSFIMFDVMNDIFLNQYGGDIKLIVHIYENLHDLLATDFNFLHQNAKCLTNYSYTIKEGEESEKKEILLRARELSVVSKTIIDNLCEKSDNEHLLISAAHVKFTIASIQSSLCNLQKYANDKEIEKTIDIVSEALESPYNIGEEKKRDQRDSQNITNFVKTIYFISNSDSIHISSMHFKKLGELFNRIIFKAPRSKN